MVAVTASLETGRALRSGRRIHRGFIAGAVLTALSVAGSYSLYQTRPVVERSIVVTTRDIPRGTVLTGGDFTIRATPLDEALHARLLQPGQEAALVGQATSEDLHAGLPIGLAQVARRDELEADQTLASLPVPADTVLLRKGDRVLVWGSTNDGRTGLVLDGVQVVEVVTEGSTRSPGAVGQDRAPRMVSVNLALRLEEARRLLEARQAGEVSVTRLPASAVQARGLAGAPGPSVHGTGAVRETAAEPGR